MFIEYFYSNTINLTMLKLILNYSMFFFILMLSTPAHSIDIVGTPLAIETTSMPFDKENNLKFTKINDTKYRVQINLKKDKTKIIFKQKYHPGWKLYIVKPSIIKLKQNSSFFQDIFETWFPIRLSKEDLESNTINNQLINKGIVENASKFVIKYFGGNVVQWPERFHSLSYEYANGWILDKSLICRIINTGHKNNNSKAINRDICMVVDIIIEYRPQKMFYILYLMLILILAYIVVYVCIRGVQRILT